MKISSMRRTAAGVVIGAVVLAGCQSLLDVNVDGQITDDQLTSAATARALRLGALSSLAAVNGAIGTFSSGAVGSVVSSLVSQSALLTDEMVNRTTTQPSPVVDQRITVGTADYGLMQQARARAFQAIDAVATYMPVSGFREAPRLQGELYFELGYLALQFAENYCAGVPLSRRVGNEIVYGERLTTTQMLDSAIAYFNAALPFLTDTIADTATVTIRRAVRVAKARAFNNRHATAADVDSVLASLGGAAPVPTNFNYRITFGGSTASSANTHWHYMQAASTAGTRGSVGDSINPNGSTMANALPFASANDPRLPVLGNSASPSSQGNGNLALPLVRQNLYRTASTPLDLVNGLDARLMEAEVALKRGNVGTGAGQMTALLNALRAQTIVLTTDVTYSGGALPPLAAPANQTAAVRLLLREKAFWTWGRGQRLGDLRRAIRQWGPPLPGRPGAIANLGFTQDVLFPVGDVYDINGSPTSSVNKYGAEINFTFGGETANPKVPRSNDAPDALNRVIGFCIDRDA